MNYSEASVKPDREGGGSTLANARASDTISIQSAVAVPKSRDSAGALKTGALKLFPHHWYPHRAPIRMHRLSVSPSVCLSRTTILSTVRWFRNLSLAPQLVEDLISTDYCRAVGNQ
jgi:hypothetical protein